MSQTASRAGPVQSYATAAAVYQTTTLGQTQQQHISTSPSRSPASQQVSHIHPPSLIINFLPAAVVWHVQAEVQERVARPPGQLPEVSKSPHICSPLVVGLSLCAAAVILGGNLEATISIRRCVFIPRQSSRRPVLPTLADCVRFRYANIVLDSPYSTVIVVVVVAGSID